MSVAYTKLYPSAALTAAQTLVGEWVDVDMYDEIIGWLNVTAFAARVNETLDVTIERWADNANGYTTLLTFTQIATTGAHSEEKTAVALLGGRIRYRIVTAGTWSSKSITFDVGIQTKRFRR